MAINIHHDTEQGCLTLHLGERFDFSIHRVFHDACLGDVAAARSYVLDLEDVTTMDSSARSPPACSRRSISMPSAELSMVVTSSRSST